MINSLPPGFIMFIGAFLIPFLPKLGRQVYMIFLVLLSSFSLFNGFGTHLTINVLDYNFIINHSDNLSLPFAIVFHIAAFITIIYGSHKDDWKENIAVISYAGAAIAALHAGDLFTLFFWWEATAFTSVFLILGGNTTRAYRAAFRYIVIQVGSGMFLLAGAVLFLYSNGNALLGQMSIDDTSGLLIFLAFGIKAAFPFLNGWLQDTYPEASEVGTIQLEDATSSESTRDFLLLEDGVGVGFNNRLSLEKQFLIPEDFTANLDSGVIPTENFTNSDLEPRHYASEVAKRPLGGISFESTGVGEVHIRLEDGTVGVVAGSHRPAGDGFLIADGELVTTGDTTTLTNENARLGMEFSLHPGRAEQGLGHGVIALNRAPKGDNNNIGERLIMESATIFDYLENTGAVPAEVSNQFSFDNTSNRFDQTGLTFDSTL